MCPARHEDLTSHQIDALLHHRWGARESETNQGLSGIHKDQRVQELRRSSEGLIQLPAKLISDEDNSGGREDLSHVGQTEGHAAAGSKRKNSQIFGWLFPSQQMGARERLLNQVIYLQVRLKTTWRGRNSF